MVTSFHTAQTRCCRSRTSAIGQPKRAYSPPVANSVHCAHAVGQKPGLIRGCMVPRDALFEAKLQVPGLLSEHSSAGFQSGARLVMDSEESCITNTSA
jgi:hypothetical protein